MAEDRNEQEDARERTKRQLDEFKKFLTQVLGAAHAASFTIVPLAGPGNCLTLAQTRIGIVRRFIAEPCDKCMPLLYRHYLN
jgi:hypothetical protein